MFTLEIDTSTVAFDNGKAVAELARLLREAARKVEQGDVTFYLHDDNGLPVGFGDVGELR